MGRASVASSLISATVLLGPIAAIGQSRATTSLRALAATPELYANRAVTLAGQFRDATRSLAITFGSPLASHQTVRVELLEGIVAVNGRPFQP